MKKRRHNRRNSSNSAQHSHRRIRASRAARVYMQQFDDVINFVPVRGEPHLWQISDVIRVEQELLQAPRVPQDFLGHGGQRAVPLIHKLHLTIAALEDWNALEHCVRWILFLIIYTTSYLVSTCTACLLFFLFYYSSRLHSSYDSLNSSFGTSKLLSILHLFFVFNLARFSLISPSYDSISHGQHP